VILTTFKKGEKKEQRELRRKITEKREKIGAITEQL
jgi:hypothetical protein